MYNILSIGRASVFVMPSFLLKLRGVGLDEIGLDKVIGENLGRGEGERQVFDFFPSSNGLFLSMMF